MPLTSEGLRWEDYCPWVFEGKVGVIWPGFTDTKMMNYMSTYLSWPSSPPPHRQLQAEWKWFQSGSSGQRQWPPSSQNPPSHEFLKEVKVKCSQFFFPDISRLCEDLKKLQSASGTNNTSSFKVYSLCPYSYCDMLPSGIFQFISKLSSTRMWIYVPNEHIRGCSGKTKPWGDNQKRIHPVQC